MSIKLDKRLFEAFRKRRGILMTSQEVYDLVYRDDAISTRISNAAALEAGAEPPGENCLRTGETWNALKKRLAAGD